MLLCKVIFRKKIVLYPVSFTPLVWCGFIATECPQSSFSWYSLWRSCGNHFVFNMSLI